MKHLINSFLRKFHYKIEREFANKKRSESYPVYLEEANKLNIDVNDYLDNNMGWIKPIPVLEEVFYPLLDEISKPVILELGPGTGRWTRFIKDRAKQLNCKAYYLIDHADWMIDFLNIYFSKDRFIKVLKNNCFTFPVKESAVDIIFSQGVFLEFNASFIYLYSKEFSRVLKPGGYCVFDYYNFESEDGWKFFIDQSNAENYYFTYYPDDFIEKIFSATGFELEKRFIYGRSNFVVFRKEI